MNARVATPEVEIPVIDVQPLIDGSNAATVAASIGRACREQGFFYVVGHGVDEDLQRRLLDLSRAFFNQPESTKLAIAMERGGRAWRGYFPVGQELTSGRPDLKEGLYFGSELGPDHPQVRAGVPMHGANLFPTEPPGMRAAVLEYIDALTRLGHTLMAGIALSLDLDADYFRRHYTADPLLLFRIFNYPPSVGDEDRWGVGEHTDYGVLTILKQDESGGLQVKSSSHWIDAPPIPGSFVCNIGDMLDRLTGGLYVSTPHRVRNQSGGARLSFPFFFDPNFSAEVRPIELRETPPTRVDREDRWDGADPHLFDGTYGDYLLDKVAKVFPLLRRSVL